MNDDIYADSYSEVWYILQNTDKELLNKIPKKLIDFIHNNMNKDYQNNINPDIPINEQKLLKETEAMLSLIYKDYWTSDEEKRIIADRYKEEILEQNKKQDIEEIFKQRKMENDNISQTALVEVKEESFIKKIINKIKNIFKFR